MLHNNISHLFASRWILAADLLLLLSGRGVNVQFFLFRVYTENYVQRLKGSLLMYKGQAISRNCCSVGLLISARFKTKITAGMKKQSVIPVMFIIYLKIQTLLRLETLTCQRKFIKNTWPCFTPSTGIFTWRTLGISCGDPIQLGSFLRLELVWLLASIAVHSNHCIPIINTDTV